MAIRKKTANADSESTFTNGSRYACILFFTGFFYWQYTKRHMYINHLAKGQIKDKVNAMTYNTSYLPTKEPRKFINNLLWTTCISKSPTN